MTGPTNWHYSFGPRRKVVFVVDRALVDALAAHPEDLRLFFLIAKQCLWHLRVE